MDVLTVQMENALNVFLNSTLTWILKIDFSVLNNANSLVVNVMKIIVAMPACQDMNLIMANVDPI